MKDLIKATHPVKMAALSLLMLVGIVGLLADSDSLALFLASKVVGGTALLAFGLLADKYGILNGVEE